jgi:hypothetical protein
MKTKLTALFVSSLFICTISFAKVWRVNNNTGISTNFTSANAAFTSNSVVNGDTIYFEGSANDYASAGASLTKQLTLIGPGYFLTSDFWSSPVQYNTSTAFLSSLEIKAPNVNVIGLKISSIYLYGPEYGNTFNANNTFINRCLVEGPIGTYGTMNGIFISQNFVRGTIGNHTGYPVTGLLITNNLVGQGFNGYDGDNGVIEYNTFGLYYPGSSSFIFSAGTFSFKNNIIKGTSNSIGTPRPNTSISYNMAQQSALLPAGNGNVNSVNMTGTNVFNDGTRNMQNDGDSYYQLSANSPAKTAGAGGTPIGAFAGTLPYKLSGIPPIPTIYNVSIPSGIATGNSVQVTFSSRSNQ